MIQDGTPIEIRELAQVRRLTTEIPGPLSRKLTARRNQSVTQSVNVMLPVFVVEAGGGVIVDVDDNSLIDFASGIAVTSVGNSAERVVHRVSQQVSRFTHTCFMVTPYQEYIQVCEILNGSTPGDHEKRSVLFNSGAEAVENAVKIARSYTGRSAIVVFDHGYHGRTNLTMALTAKSVPYKSGFGPFAPEIYRAPVSYPFRDGGLTGEQAATRAIDIIDKQVGANNLAAIIIEPIQGEGGFIVPAPGFLQSIATWCHQHGVVFIADEIQTGLARTGAMFACDHEPVVPDLITTAKGLAGGLPLAAVTGRAEIMDSPPLGGLGGTFGGNPVACAAALAVFETIDQLDLVNNARRIGEKLLPRLNSIKNTLPSMGDVRGRGAMVAVELIRSPNREPAPQLVSAVARACHKEGLVVLTCGTYGNVLRLLPPLVMPDHLLTEGLAILEWALETAGGR